MADELMLQYEVPGGPRDVMARWRATPPTWVTDFDYQLSDEAIDTLVYERHWAAWYQRLMFVGSFFFSGDTVYKVAVRFDVDPAGTKITLNGTIDEKARPAVMAAAESGSASAPA